MIVIYILYNGNSSNTGSPITEANMTSRHRTQERITDEVAVNLGFAYVHSPYSHTEKLLSSD